MEEFSEVRVLSGGKMRAPGVPLEARGTRPKMAVCIRTFKARGLPGDEVHEFKRGVDRVATDQAVVLRYPDNFALEGTRAADRAARSVRSGGRSSKSPATPSAGELEIRQGSPWSSPAAKPHLPRPGVARGDDIFDLTTVRYALGDEAIAGRQIRERALRALERATFPHGRADQDEIRHHIARQIEAVEDDRQHLGGDGLGRHILQTGGPHFREMFARAARGGRLTDEESRALALGTTSSGGAALPFTLDPTIVPTSDGALNPLRAISRTEAITTNTWLGVTSDGTSSRYSGEGVEASDDDSPGVARAEIKCERADSWNPASYEITQDYAQLEPQVASLVQRSKDELEATKLLHGTGEKEPFGLLSGAMEVETATKDSLVAADVEAAEGALPAGFQANARWLGHREIYKKLRGFDTQGGAPLWVKVPGAKPEILDLPAESLSTMDSTVESGKQVLIVGDFSYFVIVDRIGMRVLFIPQLGENGRPTGQMGLFAVWRNGAKALTPNAFRVLAVKAE